MKRLAINKSTALLTVFGTLLYWSTNNKDEAIVVFVAGSLSVWILVTVNFLLNKGRKSTRKERTINKF